MALSRTHPGLAGMVILWFSGCTNVAQVTTLADENCHHKVRDQLNAILIEEGA